MYNKKSKKDLLITSINQNDTGLSYIHCPYPIQASFIDNFFVESVVVVASTDKNTTCIGCIFIQLDQYLIPKIRLLLLYIRFQTIIIEVAPNGQDICIFLYNFLLRLRQLCVLWSIHCMILDRSKKSRCKDWPIFSLVICWKKNISGFAVHKN
jgi:hypothetical protein